MASINTIIGLGDDQMAGQCNLVFVGGIPGGGDGDRVTLRLDQSIDPPERMVETYEFFFQGEKRVMTSMTDATDKTFTVDVRVDQNWGVIQDLERWLYYTYDFQNGKALPSASVRTTGQLQYFDGQNNIVKSYTYLGLGIKGLKNGTSDMSSPDPLRTTISFIFDDFHPDDL